MSVVLRSGNVNLLETSESPRAITGIAVPFFHCTYLLSDYGENRRKASARNFAEDLRVSRKSTWGRPYSSYRRRWHDIYVCVVSHTIVGRQRMPCCSRVLRRTTCSLVTSCDLESFGITWCHWVKSPDLLPYGLLFHLLNPLPPLILPFYCLRQHCRIASFAMVKPQVYFLFAGGAGVKMEHFQPALDPRKQELLEARFLGTRVRPHFALHYCERELSSSVIDTILSRWQM